MIQRSWWRRFYSESTSVPMIVRIYFPEFSQSRRPLGAARAAALLCAVLASACTNVPANATDPDQGPTARTETSSASTDSTVTQLDMGPYASSFWIRLRELIGHPDWLRSFPRLVEQLDLRLTEPLDKVDPNRKDVQFREDIHDERGGLIMKGRFGVFRRPGPFGKDWFRELRLSLNPMTICITQREVIRTFGPAKPAEPIVMDASYQTWQAKQAIVGFQYSLIYKTSQPTGSFSFAFSSSGCAVNVAIMQDFVQN